MNSDVKKSEVLEKHGGANVKQTPRVSVVVPVYNCAEFIAETLDSALAQTFTDYEIILVNDGSPDTPFLEKALENYFDKIIYIKRKNGGAAAARNTAIENASGEFLAFLDGDDVWLPAYLESQIKAMEAKNCDMIYADAIFFGDGGESERETYMQKSPSRGAVTTESLISGACNVITSGTIARREKVLAVGMFDETLPRIVSEDFDLWFRLAKSGARLAYQTEILLKYRVRQTGLTGDSVHRAERAVAVFKSIEEKYELTHAESKLLKSRLNLVSAELEIEKGKLNLVRGNFSEARENFRKANEFDRKFRYSALASLLKIQPQIALKLFKKMRSAEAALISPNSTQK